MGAYGWNSFMQNKLCCTGRMISKKGRSVWSTVGLLIVRKEWEGVTEGERTFF